MSHNNSSNGQWDCLQAHSPSPVSHLTARSVPRWLQGSPEKRGYRKFRIQRSRWTDLVSHAYSRRLLIFFVSAVVLIYSVRLMRLNTVAFPKSSNLVHYVNIDASYSIVWIKIPDRWRTCLNLDLIQIYNIFREIFMLPKSHYLYHLPTPNK